LSICLFLPLPSSFLPLLSPSSPLPPHPSLLTPPSSLFALPPHIPASPPLPPLFRVQRSMRTGRPSSRSWRAMEELWIVRGSETS